MRRFVKSTATASDSWKCLQGASVNNTGRKFSEIFTKKAEKTTSVGAAWPSGGDDVSRNFSIQFKTADGEGTDKRCP